MANKRTYLFVTRPGVPWHSTEAWVRATTYAKARSEVSAYFDDGDLGEEDWDCYVLSRDVWHHRLSQVEREHRDDVFLRAGSTSVVQRGGGPGVACPFCGGRLGVGPGVAGKPVPTHAAPACETFARSAPETFLLKVKADMLERGAAVARQLLEAFRDDRGGEKES